MANKTLLKNGKIRILIRSKVLNLKPISKNFSIEHEADAYADRIETEIANIKEADKAKLPVDMSALYNSLHPDLKEKVQLLPQFASILGIVSAIELTLSKLIDEFMFQYNKKDKNIINRLKWWSDNYGHIKINNFSADYVRHAINKLLKEGTTGKKGISPQSTNRFKANLSSVFEFGKSIYNLKNNPCREVRSKPESKGRKRYLSLEEQKQLLNAAKQSKWNKFYLLILMALTTGARKGELENLTWNSIDWANEQALCLNTKNGTDKYIHLTDLAIIELKKFREVGNNLIFSYSSSSKVAYDFRNEWYEALDKAKIPLIDESGEKIVFHSLRHSFCSSIAATGASLQEIAKLAGHKNLQTTMRYTHLGMKHLSKVVDSTFGSLGAL